MSTNDGAPTVLLVEDEKEVAELYTAYLEPDYSVKWAYTGEQAIEYLDSEPDIVSVDRGLPDTSGTAVVEAIRERTIDPGIVMVTGSQPETDIHRTGIDDYLLKPVERQELVDTVENLLTVTDLEAKKRELSFLEVERNVLEVENSPEELEDDKTYNRLTVRIDCLKAEIMELESDVFERKQTAAG